MGLLRPPGPAGYAPIVETTPPGWVCAIAGSTARPVATATAAAMAFAGFRVVDRCMKEDPTLFTLTQGYLRPLFSTPSYGASLLNFLINHSSEPCASRRASLAR